MSRSEAACGAASPANGSPLRLGFVPLCDCAPLVMAHELGLFTARGLRVELSREIGWATIRDKIVLRELDAAHAPAAMVLGISLGIGCPSVPCATGLVLNLHGNGITLSNRLWADGVRDGTTLREFARSKTKPKPLTLGVAFACSSHNFLLQAWLRRVGLDPVSDVNIVVVPPPQMGANLRSGNLDGYCVGEPWNSLAVIQRAGWIAALSPEIAPQHPEKVLLARAEFVESCAEQHQRLVAALLEACEFCQLSENREQVVATLARAKYLNISPEAIHSSLVGPFKFRKDQVGPAADLHRFAGPGVNEPGLDKAAWARWSLLKTGLLPDSTELDRQRLASMFRSDIFHSVTSSGLLPPGSPSQTR